MIYKIEVAGQTMALTEIHFSELEAAIIAHRQSGDGWTRAGAVRITECGEKQP